MDTAPSNRAGRPLGQAIAERNGGHGMLVALIAVVVLGLGLRVGYAVDGSAEQPPDSSAYGRIAESLYRHGSFDARQPGARYEAQPSSAYSPGLPLFAAGVYWVTGGVHLTLLRVLLAILGAAAVPLTYLLGRRLGGPAAGLIGAAALAVYPALLEYQGLLLTEPLAAFLLSAALVAFFKATDRPRSIGFWALTGALLGALTLTRPEYLVIAVLLPLAWLLIEARRGQWRRAIPAVVTALLVAIAVLAPWTARNAVVLHRFVPVSTGGGKALFIGTYLDADGDGPKLRELLLSQRPALRDRLLRGGPVNDPQRLILERLLGRLAAQRYPHLDTDAALGRLGRQNLEDEISAHPAALVGMLARKGLDTWTSAPGSTMAGLPWRVLQVAILLFSILGFGVLAKRRRFEALAIGLILLYVTAIGALLIASPRRELVVLPVLAALAGVGATFAWGYLSQVRTIAFAKPSP